MIGKKFIFKDTVDSTNNYVAKLVSEGKIAHGTVILAGHQLAGKGHRGAVWEAEAHQNLLFSCWLEHENLAVNRQFALTQFVSLSLIDILQHYQIKAEIKWPNDLVINGKKIAGILIENHIGSGRIKGSIVGLGLNVNQTGFGNFNATSMLLEKEMALDLNEIAFSLVQSLQLNYTHLTNLNFGLLDQIYQDKLWLKGRWSQFKTADKTFEGRIIGTNTEGQLKMETAGEVKLFNHKEIQFLERGTEV